MVFGKRMAVEFFLVILIGASFATSLNDCPDQSQRKLRQTAFCGTSSLYYICLNNTENDNVREICANKTDFAGVGQKYVWTGNYRNVDCPSNRYQPYNLYRSDSHECQFLKSTCNELGQILHSNGSTKSDVSCRCDESKGFEFVQPIKNRYCVPSIEDCSCYLKPCTGDLCTRNAETITKSDIILTSSFIDKPSLKINGRGYTARIIVSSIFSTLVIEEVNFRDGDRVCVFPIHESKKLHRTTVGQGNTIVGCIGRTFIVKRIKPGKVIEVEDNGITYSFSHDDLKKVNDYKVGETIKVLDEIKTVKQIQEANNKEWVDGMEEVCGKVGMVVKIHSRDFVLVEFGRLPLLYHPACLIPAPDGKKINKLRRDYLDNMPPIMKSILPKYDAEMRVKDRVCVFLSMEELKELQRENWDKNMAAYIGDIGVVKRIESDLIEVEYGGCLYKFKQDALRKVFDIKAGNTVKVLEDSEIVERLQKRHGGWVSNMKEACGKVGKVLELEKDRYVVVQFGQQKWAYSPACLIPATGENVDQILIKDNVDIPSTFKDILPPGLAGIKITVAKKDTSADDTNQDEKHPGERKVANEGELRDITNHSTGIDVEDRVCVYLSPDDLEKIQQRKAEWNKTMSDVIGHIGKVICKVSDDVLEVDYEGLVYQFHKNALKKVHNFKVGDKVEVLEDSEAVKRLQEVHGGWVDDMKETCGKVGEVVMVQDNNAVVVKFGSTVWAYSLACLITASDKKVDELKRENEVDLDALMKWMSKRFRKVLKTGGSPAEVDKEPDHDHEQEEDIKSTSSKESKDVFDVEDRVCVIVSSEDLEKIQRKKDAWEKGMAKYIGQIGKVTKVESEVIEVNYEGITYKFLKEVLKKMYDIKVGDIVKVEKEVKTVKRLQEVFGGWVDNMTWACGKVGKVIKVHRNEGAVVKFKDMRWRYHQACLIPAPGQNEDKAGPGLGGNQAGFAEKIEKFLPKFLEMNQQLGIVGPEQMILVACRAGDQALVERIVKMKKEVVNFVLGDLTPLMVACHEGHQKIVEFLLSKGADINAVNSEKMCVVLSAVLGNKEELAKYLIENGANVTVKDKFGRTLAHQACLNGMPELLEALLRKECDLNTQDNEGDTPLHDAIAQGDDTIVGILLDHPSINVKIRNKKGFQPLMWAALRDHAFTVKRLLKKDIELMKSLMPDGKSALHIAAINDHREVATCLILKGKADVNLKDEKSVTALDLACIEAYYVMAKLLLENNADPNIQDANGNAALHFAIGGPANMKDMNLPGMGHATQPKSKIKRFKTACLLIGNKCNIDMRNIMGKAALDDCRSQWIRNSLNSFISKLEQRKRDNVDVNDAYLLDRLIEEVLKNEAAGAKKEEEEETDNIQCSVQ